jgi:hypothetical protein
MLTLPTGTITGDNTARMEWKHYWRNVVQRHRVMIEGWPENIPFRNLSDGCSSLTDLETLRRKWCSGSIYWKQITEHELDGMDRDRDARIERGEEEAPAPRRRRSDYGKKRPRRKPIDEARKRRRNSHRSAVEIEEEDDGDTTTPTITSDSESTED